MAQLSKDNIPDALDQISQAVTDAGGRAYLVGGCVRDKILGIACKDFDLEVFGLDEAVLEKTLAALNPVEQVGKQFGVYKLKGLPIDVALPRREKKTGEGHKGFTTESDGQMTLADAAERRDYTINAIYEDVLSGEILDPVGGAEDLKNRQLRHISAAFAEDSLRVLRGIQFIARFDLTAAPETVELCRSVLGDDLPVERIGEEFFKLLTQGKQIANGLNFLRAVGWLKYFPELERLIDCQQDPHWHPEGDVWVHTLHCLDAFARERSGDVREDWIVGLSVLCHDLGKPATTFFEGGRWRSPKHEYKGVPIAETFLKRLTRENAVIAEVLPHVECHMRPFQLFSVNAKDNAVRRLANKVGRIDRLVRVCRADKLGRPPIVPDGFPELDALAKRAEELKLSDTVPSPIIQGRDLIAEGLAPSKAFKEILEAAFEAQLEGEFLDNSEGSKWLKSYLEARGEK